jgi:23S rRNA (guanine2445-N2)-methyltransferase / 23S rRNA (guanine2069-N7)-methyltransferase
VPHGLEEALAAELRSLGIADVRPLGGGVAFDGTLADAYAACLWSRTAERILLQVARFPATTRDQLYDGLRAVDWTAHLSPRTTLACSAIGTTTAIRNSHYAALLLKDAVVDQIRDRVGERPSVDLDHPDIRLQLLLRGGDALVSLDLAGEALHRRGYRTPGRQVEAPLKETLAAGILSLAGWSAMAPHGFFLDPLCGSGTLALEAAQMAADIAPGLGRQRWGFQRWLGHEEQTWRRLADDAAGRRDAGLAALRQRTRDLGRPPFAGRDRDPRAVALARSGVLRAGLSRLVSIDIGDVRDLRSPFPSGSGAAGRTAETSTDLPGGLVATNPPYGARMAIRDLDALYAALGDTLRRELRGWRAAVLVADERRAELLGTTPRADAPRLYNGPIECTLLLFDVGSGPDAASGSSPDALLGAEREHPRHDPADRGADPRPASGTDASDDAVPASSASRGGYPSLNEAAAQFGDRLRRNVRVLGRPLLRRGVDCYRLYDADLPDFNLAVDLYADWAHVQEYQAPAHIDPDKAAARLTAAVGAIPETVGIPEDHVVVKVRRRQKGTSQYERLDRQDSLLEVHEGDAVFLVNLTDRIDTGLFLDQRQVRELIASSATGRSFLNLFGYTGAATVAAALGGAERSLTVDLSRAYLEWAQKNFRRNRLDPARHRTLRTDVTRWLREAARERTRYDLILLGPPTFSNSAGMRRATLDVQRDHVDLVRGAARLLSPRGTLLFVCGAHRFTFAVDQLAAYSPIDLSTRTLPPDFSRRARGHHVWRLSAPGHSEGEAPKRSARGPAGRASAQRRDPRTDERPRRPQSGR